MVSERDILERCIAGDKPVWDTFVETYSKLIYSAIYNILYSSNINTNMIQQLIEDLYQDVFVSLVKNDYKKLRQFKGKNGCTLASWLRMISCTVTIDYMRKTKKEKGKLSLDQEEDMISLKNKLQDKSISLPNSRLIEDEKLKMLEALVEELPEEEKCFLQFSFKGLKPDQIAKILNISVENCYTRKNRIISKLKARIKEKNLL